MHADGQMLYMYPQFACLINSKVRFNFGCIHRKRTLCVDPLTFYSRTLCEKTALLLYAAASCLRADTGTATVLWAFSATVEAGYNLNCLKHEFHSLRRQQDT